MIGQYERLAKYKGKYVELYVSSQSSHSLFIEKGIITGFALASGENSVFIEIDNNTIINARYIIKMVVKD